LIAGGMGNSMNNNYNYQFSDGNGKNSNKHLKVIIIIAVIMVVMVIAIMIPFIFISGMLKSAVKEDVSSYNVSVTAEITENIVSDRNPDSSGPMYTPVYEYEYGGKTYRVAGRHSSFPPKYQEGQKVKIMIKDQLPGKIYDPELNNETLLKNFEKEATMTFLPFIIIPLLFMVICASVIIMAVVHNNTKKRISTMQSMLSEPEQDEYFDPNDDYRG
jgi:flagellar basal body-associated protein FliL